MNKDVLKLLVILLSMGSVPGWAEERLGPSTGGGGFAVQCPQTPISPAEVELLDFYEGREVLGLQMAKSTGNLRNDYFRAVDRTYTMQGNRDYAEQNKNWINANLTKFMRNTIFVEHASDLPKASDLGNAPMVPSQCSIQQVAYFEDAANTIYILRPLWDQMDSLNQAGLVLHELFGPEIRKRGFHTSEFSRRSVAHINAVTGAAPILDGLTPSDRSLSASTSQPNGVPDVSVFVAKKLKSLGSELLRLQFSQINGMALLAKTWIDLPYVELDLERAQCTSGALLGHMILKTPGIDLQISVPLNGKLTTGMELKVEMKTGEPVRLTLSKNGVALGETAIVGGDSYCD